MAGPKLRRYFSYVVLGVVIMVLVQLLSIYL